MSEDSSLFFCISYRKDTSYSDSVTVTKHLIEKNNMLFISVITHKYKNYIQWTKHNCSPSTWKIYFKNIAYYKKNNSYVM